MLRHSLGCRLRNECLIHNRAYALLCTEVIYSVKFFKEITAHKSPRNLKMQEKELSHLDSDEEKKLQTVDRDEVAGATIDESIDPDAHLSPEERAAIVRAGTCSWV
jgi:hypothetical protein